DLDRVRGAIQVRHGKGGRRREVGMDRWAWEQLDPWLYLRAGLPIGTLFCVLRGPTRGRPCSAAGVRVQLRNAAVTAGVRRRLARPTGLPLRRWILSSYPTRLTIHHAPTPAAAFRWTRASVADGVNRPSDRQHRSALTLPCVA